jgi:hypothetical protein
MTMTYVPACHWCGQALAINLGPLSPPGFTPACSCPIEVVTTPDGNFIVQNTPPSPLMKTHRIIDDE